VESGQLDSYPTTFRFTAFLISRGIRDRETIEELFDQRILNYKEFESEQPRVERLISSAKIHYFEKRKDIPDNIKPELWKKLDTAWSNLSIKQRSALEIHIMSDDPVSLEKGAKRLKISKASFKERVQSGIKKIAMLIPELQLPPKSPKHAQSSKKITPTNFRKRSDAPKLSDLHRWIEKTVPELKFSYWDVIFKEKKIKNDSI